MELSKSSEDDRDSASDRSSSATRPSTSRVIRRAVIVKEAKKEKVRNKRDDLYTLCEKMLVQSLPPLPSLKTPAFLTPFVEFLDDSFECIRNGSTVEKEIFSGIISFFSCVYCLPVLSGYMANAGLGYDARQTISIMALLCGLGSITSGIVTNTPMIIAPPTAECIFLISTMQNYQLSPNYGNLAVVANGVFVFMLGLVGPLGRLLVKFIPNCIQIGTTVGIGLLTALAGSVELNFVQKGVFKILRNGPITPEVAIGLSGLFIIACALIIKSRFSFILPLLWGTFIWWTNQSLWPTIWVAVPDFKTDVLPYGTPSSNILAFSLMFLTLLTVFGIAKALSTLIGSIREDGSVPGQQFLILIIGLVNICSGMCFGPPFTISSETAAGIAAGAKTGLSAVVCGIFFIGAMFFGPFFAAIPVAGTSPMLIAIGMTLFMNIQRLDFAELKYTLPAFCTLFFIPFTSSTLVGLVLGYLCYFVVSVFTLDIIDNTDDLLREYFPYLYPSEAPGFSYVFNPSVTVEEGGVNAKDSTQMTQSAPSSSETAPKSALRRASAIVASSVAKDNFSTSIDIPIL